MTEAIAIISYNIKICPILLYAVCSVETNFQNIDNLKDYGNASYGVCQIKLDTARMFKKNITKKELQDPINNIYYAAQYLKWQQDRYPMNSDCIVSAYNAGKCKLNINPDYIQKVKDEYGKAKAIYNTKRYIKYTRYCY